MSTVDTDATLVVSQGAPPTAKMAVDSENMEAGDVGPTKNEAGEIVYPPAIEGVPRTATFLDGLMYLLMSLLGSGLLSIPRLFAGSFKKSETGEEIVIDGSGLIVGALCICFGVVISVWSMLMIVKAIDACKVYTFEGVAGYYMGNFGLKLYSWLTILNMVLTSMSYSNVFTAGFTKSIRTFIGCTVKDLLSSKEKGIEELVCTGGQAIVHPAFMLFLAFLLIFPILTLRSVRKLAPSATIAGILYLIAVIMFIVAYIMSIFGNGEECTGNGLNSSCVAEKPKPINNQCIDGTCKRAPKSDTFELITTSFTGISNMFANLMFTFIAHYNVPKVYSELKDPTQMRLIIWTSVAIIGAPFVIIVGIIGALMFGKEADANIFLNLNNTLGLVLIIMICLVCLLKMPLLFNLCRDLIMQETKDFINSGLKRVGSRWTFSELNFFSRAITVFFLLVIIFPVALLVKLDDITHWCGIITCSSIGWIFPGLFMMFGAAREGGGKWWQYSSIKKENKWSWIQGLLVIIIILILSGFSTFSKIEEYVRGY